MTRSSMGSRFPVFQKSCRSENQSPSANRHNPGSTFDQFAKSLQEPGTFQNFVYATFRPGFRISRNDSWISITSRADLGDPVGFALLRDLDPVSSTRSRRSSWRSRSGTSNAKAEG